MGAWAMVQGMLAAASNTINGRLFPRRHQGNKARASLPEGNFVHGTKLSVARWR
jgi:hypothetical protein